MFYAMKNSIGPLVALAVAGSLLAACNGGNAYNNVPAGTGNNCGGPPGANQVEVLYPKPGWKKAPPGLGTIYISTKGQLPAGSQYNLFLSQSNGGFSATSIFFGTSKSKLPTPHAEPSYPNPVYYATSLPPSYIIGPAQSVSVLWNIANGCTPRFQVSSFTTSS
jgi:hypothetical protein